MKHQQFATEYVKHFNATKAYKAVHPGVTIKTAGQLGCQTLKDLRVQNIIQSLLKEQDVTAEMVIAELKRIAFCRATDIVSWDNAGNTTLIPSSEISEDVDASVLIIARPGRQGQTIEIKRENKLAALEILAKYTGISNKTSVELSGKVDVALSFADLAVLASDTTDTTPTSGSEIEHK